MREGRAAAEQPLIEQVARNYKQFELLTQEAVCVNPMLATLCIAVSQQHIDEARKQAGPHAHTAIRVFMNDLAAAAFRESAATYPVGSVVVKEKQGMDYFGGNDSVDGLAKTRDGIGGMIKRAPGYEPENGDWEYFYFADPSKIEQGRIASCVGCHRSAAKTDFVFGDWAR